MKKELKKDADYADMIDKDKSKRGGERESGRMGERKSPLRGDEKRKKTKEEKHLISYKTTGYVIPTEEHAEGG